MYCNIDWFEEYQVSCRPKKNTTVWKNIYSFLSKCRKKFNGIHHYKTTNQLGENFLNMLKVCMHTYTQRGFTYNVFTHNDSQSENT